ncbi:thyrotropin-releasing hormone-degrading ectoenzyme-like [Brienomyrus brachyistius]|uniref:thyrotropin-releasing hormone-degrading ectoenzyme-like n=1 Tax=Brienomyrus brachyistius TaxID=42636 RepID=UPI0020B1FEB2|nr:thyrotropin-releasing hormone-degrading ectoenzyme-like [Brienomyrus brachyistius]
MYAIHNSLFNACCQKLLPETLLLQLIVHRRFCPERRFPLSMTLENKRGKGLSFTAMGTEDDSLRNGRRVSDQWADSVAVRPRTAERRLTVHKRMALGFAVSVLTLILLTVIAVLLSFKFEDCSGEISPRAPNTSTSKSNQSRDPQVSQRDEDVQPWRQSRLPGSLRPRHYDLRLSVYMDNFTFSGEVYIEFECVNSTKFIVLHVDGLRVEKVAVSSDSKKPGVLRLHRQFYYPSNQLYVIALYRELKPLRIYKMNITFEAQIENELLGFFRSSYVLHGERRFLAVTQFSPTHARKAFPCFDEPIYKATFKVSLKHDSAYVSLSNMPVEMSVLDEDGWVTNSFSRTPRMSTYYLAWTVCNFTYKETFTKSGVLIRLYARPNAINRGSGDYALNITKKLLQFYEDYFKVKYSLPKLDLLAVPKHPYAAMENWGLSVFVEQKILLDPKVSSFSYLMELTMVVVHEICHQWFGDLVTPAWWEDVWLKEGFAHFFEYIGTDFLFPKWNMEKQRFLTDVLHEVMLLDGLASSHPISQEVYQAADIDRVFDWIAYKKGAALIRMLANVLGQPVFQRALNDYLRTHMYGNAGRDDLWNKFSEAMQKEGKHINIKEVMDGWTLQMGYPVVTISRNESLDHSVTISQEHFLYHTDAKRGDMKLLNTSFQWQIPLTLSVGNSTHVSSESVIWVSDRSELHRISLLREGTWLLGNINQTGYFRVNYDLQNWKLLLEQLMRNPEIISVGNRAGLIDDVFNLARAGYLPQNIPMEIICYLPQEREFLPWHAASRCLYQLDKLLDRTDEYSVFSDYVLKQVASVYHRLGWPTSSSNSSIMQAAYQTQELQREVIMLACSFGNKHCHRQAVSLISDWISSNKNRIPPNVRDIVYCTGVSLMDEDVWEFIWMKFHSTTAISEKKVLLEALTCSDNTFLLNRLLNLSLSTDLVPDQDVIDIIIHVGRNPHGRPLAWRYFREKWDILNARYGEALFMNSKLISGVTEFLNTESELSELKEFIQDNEGEASSALARAVEIVEANVRWHCHYRQQFFQWLRKRPSS